MKNFLSIVLTIISGWSFAQSPMTSEPFELHGDHIFIKVSVDDSEPLDFIFDTGDGLSVLDLDVAKKLGLNMDHKQTTRSAQGTITGALIKHNKFAINEFVMEGDVKMYATSLKHLEMSIGRNVDGIVGYDLLVHHAVRLDYDKSTIEIYEPGNFPKRGEAVSFKLHNAIPTVKATVKLNNEETLEGTYYVNTGAGTTVDFNSPFANANDIIGKTGTHYSYPVKGLGDTETKHFEGRVQEFKMGKVSIPQMPIGISQSSTGLQGDKKLSGIIGNRFLKRFDIIFDYKGNTMYLEPNENYDEPMVVNCSGLDVTLAEGLEKVVIHRVFEDSPAKEAGVMLDDELVSINGKSASELGLPKVKKMLKQNGQDVTLVIKRGGEEKEISFKLKSLI